MGRYDGKLGYRKPANAPTSVPTTASFHWAAGIYEGEGAIAGKQGYMTVNVGQRNRWILDKLRDLFGGRVYTQGKRQWQWSVSGARARGFVQSVYGLLSPRRQAQALRYFDWCA